MRHSALGDAQGVTVRQGVRNPVTRSGSRSFRGHYNLGAYESRPERLGAWICAADDRYDLIKFQPLKIRLLDGDRVVEHTPDLLAAGSDISLLLECKPDDIANSDKVRRRTELVRPICARHGFVYAVWTMTQIALEPRYSNALHLEYFRRPDMSQELIDRLVAALPFGEKASVAYLADALGCDNENGVYSLIANRWLSFDQTRRLDAQSTVFRRERRTLVSVSSAIGP